MIHESLLFRFNSFQYLVSHTSTVSRQPARPTSTMRINTENMEIRKYAKRTQNLPRPLGPQNYLCWGVGNMTLGPHQIIQLTKTMYGSLPAQSRFSFVKVSSNWLQCELKIINMECFCLYYPSCLYHKCSRYPRRGLKSESCSWPEGLYRVTPMFNQVIRIRADTY